ncbi:unnamed protein product [Litomosoides sigmodontis]|uniref:Chorein N-terminal domain-containing protein n=1 Tax=Litomosoides sigmodontis TaxID=42156 RepID=A0A3P6SSE3_LITSI|nr:unnamed protein product [Litomosoides sigmodontis]
MANIIKNQIIKHLSKFARNITADQISVQILSGKGELRNIELNEIVLSEVGPGITNVVTNQASTLQQNSRQDSLDETKITASETSNFFFLYWNTELAELDRKETNFDHVYNSCQSLRLLFIDEIRVEVELSSEEVFEHGSNPLSAFGDSTYGFANRVAEGMSLYVNSVEINFDSGVFRGSLALTKLAVESKSAGWQTVSDLRYTRLEDTKDNKLLLFKMAYFFKYLMILLGTFYFMIYANQKDGRVLNGRIQILLDHILWIATLPQVRSAIAFYDHIMSIIKASPKKVPKIYHTQIVEIKIPAAKSNSSITIPNAFRHFDVQRTSYHVCVGRIDFHLCDDDQTINSHPVDWDIDCGALQVSLVRLSLDFYPSNIASSDRSNWIRYDNANDCASWVQKILQFHLCKLYNDFDPSAHSQIVELWPKLMSQNCVIRMHDIIVQCVTDMNSKKEAMFNLFMSDRKPNTSEADSPLFHLELASFYHPTCKSFPVPANVTHLLLGPFFFLIDQRTIRWLLFVINDIKYALQISKIMHEVSRMPKTYVRVDLLMPKVIIPLKEPFMRDKRFARRVVISMNTWSATNCKAVFGDESASFFKSISSNIIDFIDCIDIGQENMLFCGFPLFELVALSSLIRVTDTLVSERIWISTSPIQINTDSGEGVWSTPLLASVAFHALISAEPMRVNVAVQPMSKIRVAINHFQFIQIMNLISNISDFVDQLVNDQKFFSAERSDGSCTTIELVCFLREIELNIILPNEQIPTPYDAQKPVQLPTTPSDG